MDSEKINILICDDLPDKLLVYRSVLEELGENVIEVRSGAEALKQVLKHDFAVILLDVNMPGMDGFETAQLIRQRRRSAHTPIIFLTAFADEVHTAQGYATGGVDYLPTPVVAEILRAKVRVFIDLFRLRKQVARQAEEQAKRAAAEESARRSAFLAEASRAITSSLDIETTIRQLLRVCVPTLADMAGFTHVPTHGQPWKSEIAWRDEASDELRYHTILAASAPDDELRSCHDRVLATGMPEQLDNLNIVYGFKDERGPFVGYVKSALVLPLMARGRTLGALLLTWGRDHRLSKEDLALAEDLAGRAGIALDNAMLVRDIQDNDQRKNEFLAMLAHELRNPLAPIRNALDLLQMVGLDPSELKWARDVMDRQVNHLVRLVDDLLDVSRITRGKIQLQQELLTIGAVVASAVETSRPVIEAHSHNLQVSVPEEPILVQGDPARLSQVFANLLNNAAKYTPDGGTIEVAVSIAQSEVLVRISDTGAGIPKEMLANVFELFTQVDRSLDRSQGGLGIGLTLVRRLVEMHGGSVHAHSEGIGRGSEFVVHLPLALSEHVVPAGPCDAPKHGLERKPCRILIVDDNVDAAETLAVLLRAANHEVHLSRDGMSALETARTLRPEVVLLDIGLPELNGYEVARRMRNEPATKHALLVAVSGYGQEEDRRRSQQSGFDHHLIKPVDFNVLRALLAAHPGHSTSKSQFSAIA